MQRDAFDCIVNLVIGQKTLKRAGCQYDREKIRRWLIPAKLNPMARERFTIPLFCLFAFMATGLFGQTEQFKFKRLDLKDGLSHPEIWAMYKDSRGFLWFGTGYGLSRFDGYTIKSFFNDPHDSTSLPGDGIYKISETPDGLMAISTTKGLTLYDPETEKFQRHLQSFFTKYGTSNDLSRIIPGRDGSYWFIETNKLIRYDSKEKKHVVIASIGSDSSSIVSDPITDFCIDRNNNHWVVHSNGIVEKIEVYNGQGRVVERISILRDHNNSRTNYRMIADSDGDLWFCTPAINQGVFYYSIEDKKLEHISARTKPLQLNTSWATDLVEDVNGLIWVSTDHGGINVVDKERNNVQYILHRDGDEMSLSANSISYLYKDDEGIIWAGAAKRGISYYHPNIYRFDIYKHSSVDPGSLPFEDVNRFEEDRKGNLWIGTNGGGLIYLDRVTGKFTQYKHDPNNDNSISGNVIVSLYRDAEDNLWIGTFKGGLCKFDGKKFTRYRNVPGDDTSLPSQNIWELFEDSKKRFWIGTIDQGAALFDRKTGKFQKVRIWGPNALQSPTIEAIEEDRHGNIWFGTTAGIDVLSEDGKTFTHYGASREPNSLSDNLVVDIMKDSKSRLWVCTLGGLNLFDDSTKGFKAFAVGIENHVRKSVLAIEEDNFGNIWMSTLNGLTKMTLINGSLDSVSFKPYTESDGLQGRQFNVSASFKTRRGELIFGGPTGFNIMNGAEHREDFVIRKIVFSELELYEKPVTIGEQIDGVVVLDRSISEAKKIVLPPNRNFFSLKFSALNYFNPDRDKYVYMLEGLNTGWLPVDARNHEIVFNSLNPGRYVLRLRAANSDGVWSDKEAVLAIVMLPPFWKTKTAFVIYIILLVVILLVARRVIQQREKLKYAIDRERREMQRVHELDMMKVKFFTNVSHEFRTPLTLILTPIERLLKKTSDPEQQGQFQLIYRNGRRLMNLVNQLLDFKKLEVYETKLNPTKGDIIAFIKETVLSFSDLSEKKNIKLSFSSSVERCDTFFDHDKLEKILFNLLGNAFKFTLENGLVTVKVGEVQEGAERLLQIDVSDTGIGIPKNKIDKIFEPFFQTDVPKNIVNPGSGIGLAITKEFVRIHGGRLEVVSEVGRGSSFKVMLPLREIPGEEEVSDILEEIGMPEEVEEASIQNSIAAADPNERYVGATKKKSLLLIDDNDDFRFYLRDNLKFHYTIHEAGNGADGWDLVLSVQPDLIVSDIMMPEINGIELCAKIKSDERVSHIPVILLTARSSPEQRIEGLKTGADDYITKPFNFEVLEARINNLLEQREKFQKTFRKTLEVKSSELQITPLDVKFIEKAVKVVEAHVSSPDFSVEDLGMELGISRAYVFKKILALTGKTPLEFIRTIRLQHAAQLLEKSQLSVREVAYKVGFNNPKYFTKYFKEQYSILPSDYAASKKDAG
jgi:signal transduction histidine kinase/ligand-binding sensor domain-containing protein/DNA-binding response OmpR family regulator